VEEVGDGQLTPPLFNQGHFEAKGSFWRAIQSRDAEASRVKTSLRQGSC
jgi:hypothetical protein